MRIGIDIDDTICNTSAIVHDRMEKYSKEHQLSPVMIMNEEEYKIAFFQEMLEDIYTNVEIKENAKEVLRRLKNKGNEIYLITARSNFLSHHNVEEITRNWLKKQEIEVDKIIMNAYGEAKAKACVDNKIDLMIDDDPNNYRNITLHHIPCLLFDDEEQFDLKRNYVTNWLEVEEYIERNR